MTHTPGAQVYEGLADTLEAALEKATTQIPLQAGRDFVISRVFEWGMQIGGFTLEKKFYVKVVEDPTAAFKT
jgi:hypothetical protein